MFYFVSVGPQLTKWFAMVRLMRSGITLILGRQLGSCLMKRVGLEGRDVVYV